MAFFNASTREMIGAMANGIEVDRDTAALPQTATAAIFNVVGGRVLVKQILGQVTTIIQNQACNAKLTANPTTGSDVDMCADLDIKAIEVGGKLSITGTAATALGKANAGAIIAQATPVIVDPGTIDLTTSASDSGAVKWSIWYIPLDTGAYITAA